MIGSVGGLARVGNQQQGGGDWCVGDWQGVGDRQRGGGNRQQGRLAGWTGGRQVKGSGKGAIGGED